MRGSSPCKSAACTGAASVRAREISAACQRARDISSMRYLRPAGPPGFHATRIWAEISRRTVEVE